MADKPHVVVLGGGFGGLTATKTLAKAPVRVTVVDRSNHHLFQPLLYQVATSALAAPDIASPIRKLLRQQEDCEVLMATVRHIDVERKTLILDQGELAYDYLILAAGMTNSYFGNDEWEWHAPGLKTLTDALRIRNLVLRTFERAEVEPREHIRKELLTFVVIGGGPTGVEMAGALAEIATRTLAADFDRFDPAEDARVILVEGSDRILGGFHEESSRSAEKALRQLGVEIVYGKFVTSVREDGITVGDEDIAARTVVWAAGVKGSPLTEDLDVPLDRAGRVLVEPDLTVPGHPEIYVLGDLIALEQDGRPLPGVAQLAIQSGKYAATTLRRRLAQQDQLVRPFRYQDRGSMSTIGRNRAVAEVGERRFSGFVAWLLWVFVHVMFLVDFRNRVVVMFEWAWSYLTWRRSARVILREPDELEEWVSLQRRSAPPPAAEEE